mgnify:CR=1 FL=1
MRGATYDPYVMIYDKPFQSTRPMRGATQRGTLRRCHARVSIHAPHAGRDCSPQPSSTASVVSIHAPHAGRDLRHFPTPQGSDQFQSTRPMRGATLNWSLELYQQAFQSTRPMRGATKGKWAGKPVLLVSIHAPHAGRDTRLAIHGGTRSVSIHAPHAGRDLRDLPWRPRERCFNPRAPCGARQRKQRGHSVHGAVSIHAPHAGRDAVVLH